MSSIDITLLLLIIVISIGLSAVIIIQYNDIIEVKENLTEIESQLESCKISVKLCTEMYNEVRTP